MKNNKLTNKYNKLKSVFLKNKTYFNSNRKIPPVSRPTHPQPSLPKEILIIFDWQERFCSDIYL